ncbi:MAG: hypothetical protein Q7R57_00980 [Dehalococcoidales bacterium]|nr:hypothetical protein [Dehalococcoidales bacterium]
MVQRVIVEEKQRSFVKDSCNSRCSLQLLLFLGRHPHARFSQLAIVHAVDARRADVEKALRNLQERGLVMMWNADNGLPFYSLTGDEALSRQVMELMSLDWWQYHLMLDEL